MSSLEREPVRRERRGRRSRDRKDRKGRKLGLLSVGMDAATSGSI